MSRSLAPSQILFVLSLLVALAPEATAAPLCPAAPADTVDVARRAAAAFAAMEGAGFDQARAELLEQVGCLSAPPDPSQAAALHLVEALAAFRSKDNPLAVAELQAAHESDPSFVLSPTVAPAGGLLQRRDADARALPAAAREAHGLAARVIVDGREAPDLPVSRSALVVVLGADGSVRWSGLVAAGAKIPALPPEPTAVSVVKPSGGTLPEPETGGSSGGREPSRASRPLLLAAGGSAVLAGVLTALYVPALRDVESAAELSAASASEDDWLAAGFSSKPKDEDALLAIRSEARGYQVGAQAAAGLALSLGVVGLVIRW